MSLPIDNVPSTKEEASKLGLKYYFTGKPCKYGHIAARDTTHDNKCLTCIQQSNRRAQAKYQRTVNGKDKQAKHSKEWRTKNLEECRLKDRVKYYQKQLDKALDALSTFQTLTN